LHGTRRVDEAVRSLSGYKTPSGSIKENQAKLGFKLRHMPANRGLARLQLTRGGKKTAVLQDSEE
jgi:hypothetical protein